MPYLYLPNSKVSLMAELIYRIQETTIEEDDPTKKGAKRQIPAVDVTLVEASLIEEEDANGDANSVPFYETFVGADVQVILAWRDSQLHRTLPTGEVTDEGPVVVQLPLPKSLEVK